MKISLSRPQEGQRRHIVVSCAVQEAGDVYDIIYDYVLEGQARPERDYNRRRGTVKYRLHRRYLDNVLLAFPFADMSPGMERRLVQLSRTEYEELPIPDLEIPEFRGELYDFQKIGVDRILTYDRFLLNDEMGLGKTIQALAALVAHGQFPALAAVPNRVKYTWKRLGERFTDLDICVVDGTAVQRARQISRYADLTVVNVEALRAKEIKEVQGQREVVVGHNFVHPGLFDVEWEFFIADEYHRFKNPDAQQTIGFQQIAAKKQLFMSGTPILNRPEEIFVPLNKLWPERYPNQWVFERNLCIRSRRHRRQTVGYNPAQMRKLRNFIQNPSRSLRRRKEMVVRDLPEKIYNTMLVEMTAEQQRIYNRIRDELLLQLDSGEIQNIRGVLPQITRLKQACFSPELFEGSNTSAKINELKDVVKELTDSREKVLIFSQWSKATRIMERELADYQPAYVDGTVNVRKQEKEIDRFNNDPNCKVFIGTIGACREGIDLGIASYVIFTDKGWTPAANEQAIARSAAGGLRGAGRTGPVNIIELFADNTIEERIEAMLRSKQLMFNQLVESDGGVMPERVTLGELREIIEAA